MSGPSLPAPTSQDQERMFARVQNQSTIQMLRELRTVSDMRKVTDFDDDFRETLDRLLENYMQQQNQLQSTLSEIQVLSELRAVSDRGGAIRDDIRSALQGLLARDDARRSSRSNSAHTTASTDSPSDSVSDTEVEYDLCEKAPTPPRTDASPLVPARRTSRHASVDGVPSAFESDSSCDSTSHDSASHHGASNVLLQYHRRPAPPRSSPRSTPRRSRHQVPAGPVHGGPPPCPPPPPPMPPVPFDTPAVTPIRHARVPTPPPPLRTVDSTTIRRLAVTQAMDISRELNAVRHSALAAVNSTARSTLERLFARQTGDLSRETDANEDPVSTEAAAEVQQVRRAGRVAALLTGRFRDQLEAIWNPQHVLSHTNGVHVRPPTSASNQRAQVPSSSSFPSMPSAAARGEGGVRAPIPAYRDTLLQPAQTPLVRGTDWSEQLASELHDIHYRQPVQELLDSEFRTALERLVRRHAERQGLGNRVPPVRVGPPPRFDHPVRAIYADRPPTATPTEQHGSYNQLQHVRMDTYSSHATRQLEQRVTELQTELSEMRRMMQTSMDMQLEIQRSIRQELAAALHHPPSAQQYPRGSSDIHPGSTATQTAHPPYQHGHQHQTGARYRNQESRDNNASTCLVCCDKDTDSLLYSCGHMCTCNSCGRHLIEEGHGCPICRAPIREVVRVYQV